MTLALKLSFRGMGRADGVNAVPLLLDDMLVWVTFARLAMAPTDAVGCSISELLVSWLERKVPSGRGADGSIVWSDLELVFAEALLPADDPLGVVGRCAIEIERNECLDVRCFQLMP
jgi:hypothetical protein